jgi:hypothetical protein
MPRVLNKYKDKPLPPDSVYVGRPSKWGNPFEIGKHGTREEVIQMFSELVEQIPEFRVQIKRELCGKDLVCFCSPNPCHGDVLLRIANETR